MALVNSGFNGTVDEAQFANMAYIGQMEGVASSAAWAVTQGTGRQTSTAAQAGYAFAKGVLSKDASAAILTSLSTPTNGQWFLICRHIDWTTDTVTVIALAHTTTTTTIPTAAPAGLPTMSTTPGAQWDQPLAWAWVRSTDTTMFLVDLRKQPLDIRLAAAEAAIAAAAGTVTNAADLDALVLISASAYESRIAHVDDMNANFQAQDGVWVQISEAVFASAAARDTAYAKASAAYKVLGARVRRTDSLWTEEYFTTGAGVAVAGWYPLFGIGTPQFCAPGGNAQTPSGWTLVAAAYGTPTVNTGFTSFSGGALTVAQAGLYRVSANFLTAAGAGVKGIQIVKNSTSVDTSATIVNSQNAVASAVAGGASGTALCKLAAADILRLYVVDTAGTVIPANPFNINFSVGYEGPA